MRIDVIVVIYNVRLEELACARQGWQGDACGRVIVCDNSDQESDNAEASEHYPHLTYVNMGGNRGISRAYNRALQYCEADFVCLLDDDTPIPDDYLVRASCHVARSSSDVFVPVVRAGGLIYSPSRRGMLTFSPVSSLEEVGGQGDFGFINSGLVLRRSSLSGKPFDERLFLDYVDHAFMRDAVAAGLRIEIMPELEIEQRFSFQEYDAQMERRRFSLFRRDTRAYFRRDRLGWLLGTTVILGRLLRLTKKYGPSFLIRGGDA